MESFLKHPFTALLVKRFFDYFCVHYYSFFEKEHFTKMKGSYFVY